MVKMIDNYTLVQVIGQGNYGKVYRGKNIKTNQQYAIKIIPADKLEQNSKLKECTMNEVQTLTIIGQTEHIIMYYEMLKTKNNYYFVYEFCNGGTLMELLAKQHHLEESRALDIFKQLLQAFKVLNRLNIMHRDLKPENIFFSDNKMKLGDFGFCKGLRPEENLTKTMLGSPIYMAPQVLKGQAYSTKADIWSLGVILYEMLYGVCPFQSSSIAMLINTINTHDITLPSSIIVSQKTQQLLKKLLTKDYFRRIGWIELFNWFDEDSTEQKENIFKSSSINNRSGIQKKNSLVEEWVSKNKLSELNIKQRSVSQDITKKQRAKFDLGSLGNISPSNFQERMTPTNLEEMTTPYNHKHGEENKNAEDSSEPSNQLITEQKSYSAIRQPVNTPNAYQGYRKPASVPKKQGLVTGQQQGSYGHSSGYKPQSSKKIFYSQNYQSIFQTPLTEKSSKMNDKSIETMIQKSTENIERDQADLQESIGSSNLIQNQKNRMNERLSMTKNSLINSRGNNGPITGSRNIKQIKSQYQKQKRRQMLQIHQSCLIVLNETYKKLQQRRQSYLRPAYMVMIMVLQRLKEIIREINIVEIDLLDVSSLINYEIIQVERMVVDIKEQLDNVLEQVPQAVEDVQDALESENEKVIKGFLLGKVGVLEQETMNQQHNEVKSAAFVQNTSIINMLPKQINEKHQLPSTFNSEQLTLFANNPKSKAQYYTTNQFSEYYKNLVQSKQKNIVSKISMIS